MIYNCHTHTVHSHDSKAPAGSMCRAAAAAGLQGLAVTDHCDCEYAVEDSVFDRIAASVRDAAVCKEQFAGRLLVMTGVELGDALFDPAFAREITAAFDYDVILGSVHSVRSPKDDTPFSRIDFSLWTDAQVNSYLRRYFDDLSQTMEDFDFDVVSHLTVPLRYICGKYQKKVNLDFYLPQIEEILQKTVRMGKTLELNTQGADEKGGGVCPDGSIVDLYLSLGGTEFTLGSDAHTPEAVAAGLEAGRRLLLAKGVTQANYYRSRKIVKYRL